MMLSSVCSWYLQSFEMFRYIVNRVLHLPNIQAQLLEDDCNGLSIIVAIFWIHQFECLSFLNISTCFINQ